MANGAKAEEPDAVTVPLKVSTELVAALDVRELLVTPDPWELLVTWLELAPEEAVFSPQPARPKSNPQAIPPHNA